MDASVDGTGGSPLSGSSACDHSVHNKSVPWLLLLLHHADCSDRIRHRCLSLVRSQGLAVLRIDQRSFAGQFARFEANSPSWDCPVALAAGVDSKRPC